MAEIVVGMAQLQSRLKTLERTLQRKALVDAAKAGAKIVQEDATRRAPRDTGGLAMRMTSRVAGRDSDVNEGSVDVGPDKQNFYGFFQEYGTAHHPAHPFLGPALEDNRDAITRTVIDTLESILNKVTRPWR